eukprot:g3674.t1
MLGPPVLLPVLIGYDLTHWAYRWGFRAFGNKTTTVRAAEEALEPTQVSIPQDQSTTLLCAYFAGLQLIFIQESVHLIYAWLLFFGFFTYGYQRLRYLRMSKPLHIATHRVESTYNKTWVSIIGVYAFIERYWRYRADPLKHENYNIASDIGNYVFLSIPRQVMVTMILQGTAVMALCFGILLAMDHLLFDETTSKWKLGREDQDLETDITSTSPDRVAQGDYDSLERLSSYYAMGPVQPCGS